MGKYANNFVKCPNCGHIGNTPAMQQCVICAHSLKRSAVRFRRGIFAGGITAFALGAAVLLFRPPILSVDVQQQANDVRNQAGCGMTSAMALQT